MNPLVYLDQVATYDGGDVSMENPVIVPIESTPVVSSTLVASIGEPTIYVEEIKTEALMIPPAEIF